MSRCHHSRDVTAIDASRPAGIHHSCWQTILPGQTLQVADAPATCIDPGTVCASAIGECPLGCSGTPGACAGRATCAFDVVLCSGQAAPVAATCGTGTDVDGDQCKVNAAGNDCESPTGSCRFVAEFTPMCDLDASTDSSAICPLGCDRGLGSLAVDCPGECSYTSGQSCQAAPKHTDLVVSDMSEDSTVITFATDLSASDGSASSRCVITRSEYVPEVARSWGKITAAVVGAAIDATPAQGSDTVTRFRRRKHPGRPACSTRRRETCRYL